MDNNLGAAVDSQIGLISNEQLYKVIDQRAGVRKLIWRETLVQAAVFREWLMRNSNMPAHGAMAHFFCEMFVRARAAGLVTDNSIALPITQEMLSDALGLTSVHVNRTLMLLRDAGAVEWRSGRLIVHDWGKLSVTADLANIICTFETPEHAARSCGLHPLSDAMNRALPRSGSAGDGVDLFFMSYRGAEEDAGFAKPSDLSPATLGERMSEGRRAAECALAIRDKIDRAPHADLRVHRVPSVLAAG
jgi:hypothetical protein